MKFEIPDTTNHGGQISFWTDEITTPGNSVRAMTINRSQNVGIQISNPTRALTVSTRIACVVSGTTANAAILFGDDDDDSQGQVRYNNSDDSMELRTNSTAFLIAEKTDIASINGGSPTAFDLLTTFSMLKPFLYISTLNLFGISAAVGIL